MQKVICVYRNISLQQNPLFPSQRKFSNISKEFALYCIIWDELHLQRERAFICYNRLRIWKVLCITTYKVISMTSWHPSSSNDFNGMVFHTRYRVSLSVCVYYVGINVNCAHQTKEKTNQGKETNRPDIKTVCSLLLERKYKAIENLSAVVPRYTVFRLETFRSLCTIHRCQCTTVTVPHPEPAQSTSRLTTHWSKMHVNNLEPTEPSAKTVCNAAFCIYGFRMRLTVNSDYFLKQR
jgi:hypothetical protein